MRCDRWHGIIRDLFRLPVFSGSVANPWSSNGFSDQFRLRAGRYSRASTGPADEFLTGIWPMLLIFGVFYFMLIRPQMKRAKEARAMVAALAKGDEVLTNGGLLGRIEDISETFVTLEIADKISVKLQKSAITTVLPKGTIKQA
ncbi:MAG: preprotein translocase subunit YajC [Xanthomonadales bacterium]|nr:preprotein translocase subunit YajC [Xanthomonadales bacterium]